MNLFDKINLFYKKAQQAMHPDSIVKTMAQSILNKVVNHPHVPEDHKSKIKSDLNVLMKNYHTDSNWDSNLAHIMDEVNAEKTGAHGTELGTFYQEMYEMLSSAWDSIERSGKKPHVNKPISAHQVG